MPDTYVICLDCGAEVDMPNRDDFDSDERRDMRLVACPQCRIEMRVKMWERQKGGVHIRTEE